MKFLSKLQIEFLDLEEIKRLNLDRNRPWARLIAPILFEVKGVVYEIPVGFLTDFASTPSFIWSVLPPTDPRYIKEAVVHDWNYQNDGRLIVSGCDCECPVHDIGGREASDDLFSEMMQASKNVGFIPRSFIMGAVRSAGWAAWNEYRKLEKSK